MVQRLGVVAALVLAACARGPETPPFTGEPYLVVWAGDADRASADFLAVLDADPGSVTYGKVLRTYPVRSRGNEPHRMIAEPRADGRVFAGGLLTNRTFLFDLRQPLAARLLHVDEPDPTRRLRAPHAYVSLPNGRVLVACSDPAGGRGDPRELLAATGGLTELGADGVFVREILGADPAARHLIIAPYGVAASPRLGRVLTTNAGRGYASTAQGERAPGISVQIWSLPGLELRDTVVLEAGPRGDENLGPLTAHFLRRSSFVLVSTDEGGALYASDSVNSNTPAFRLVYDFGAGARVGETAVTPDDRFYVAALGGPSRVVSLDVTDPWHPKPVSTVRLDRDPLSGGSRRGGPHGLTMSADGTRVAVADYTVDVPTYRQDGDRRVYLLRLDPATGRLGIDGAFRDERAGEAGVSFERTTWPHGGTGPARPSALLFVAPAPPPSK